MKSGNGVNQNAYTQLWVQSKYEKTSCVFIILI